MHEGFPCKEELMTALIGKLKIAARVAQGVVLNKTLKVFEQLLSEELERKAPKAMKITKNDN